MLPCQCDMCELDRLTDYWIERRAEMEPTRKPLPPLTGIAGLGNVLAEAKKGIAQLRNVTGALGTETAALVTDVNAVRDHVRRVHEDLHFEASTLGNGGEKISDESSEKQVIKSEEVGELSPLPDGSAAAPAEPSH